MSGLTDPADGAFDITPNDDTDLTITTRGLYIGVAGDVTVTMANGDNITYVAMTAGIIHPLRIRRVYATGTDATDIIGVL